MTQGARIDLRVDGEHVVWTPAGFRGFTPRGRRLAEQLGRIVRPEERPGDSPSLTSWTAGRLRELDLPALEIQSVRFSAGDGSVPTGAIA